MSYAKTAEVASSLRPPISGKPMKLPTSRPKTPTTPGLSDKMRAETGKALETLLKKGSFQTGLEVLFKTAAPLPTAQIAGAGPFMSAARALPSKMLSPIKRGLGLAALGAGGALAYGAHKQNVQDRENNSLVYAPMQGSVMG